MGEAHFALAMWHRKNGTDLKLALDHLNRVRRRAGSPMRMATVRGWRIELLFRTGDVDGAFVEIDRLVAEGDDVAWAWDWCAQQVARYGRMSAEAAQKAVQFWDDYLREHSNSVVAQRQRLFCLSRLHRAGLATTDWKSLRAAVARVDTGDAESALLWDRVGHWAQDDQRWDDAAAAYQKAFDVDPGLYGYCLGTALSRVGRYAEALPILLAQAKPTSLMH